MNPGAAGSSESKCQNTTPTRRFPSLWAIFGSRQMRRVCLGLKTSWYLGQNAQNADCKHFVWTLIHQPCLLEMYIYTLLSG